MSSILAVGIATIDIINEVSSYPDEDSEIRANAQSFQRGGNATNTLTVLSQLGHLCSWAGTLADDSNQLIIMNDLQRYNIDTTNTSIIQKATNPTSYILHSLSNASRSIVHFRDLPEYDVESFKTIELTSFDWIHFEGRNIEAVYLMQQYCKEHYPQLLISVEIEKIRASTEQLDKTEKLAENADVILYSKDYAVKKGYTSANEFLIEKYTQLKDRMHNKIISCTWSDEGASLIYAGKVYSSPAYLQDKVIDTLGAGDTYNAALIHALTQAMTRQSKLQSKEVKKSDIFNTIKMKNILNFACKIAGQKCSQRGLHLSFLDSLYLTDFT